MNYGLTPQSFLYVNDGKGKFTDIAKTKNPDISQIGLVTDALWCDVTGDKCKELVIVGEWMTPRIFSFTGDHFEEQKTNLGNLYGWWQSLEASDLDGDGDLDLILGNIGENFYLQPDQQHPVKMWIRDFDQNSTIDKIITRNIDGKDKPVFLKREITDQLPSLKKQNLKHAEFAKNSIQELFSTITLDSAEVKKFNYTSSCIAINDGNGKFTIRKLPVTVQFSSVNAIHCMDINHDGSVDLVVGGNIFSCLPQFGRLDASYGNVLLNNGKGVFVPLEPGQSGLELRGEIRDIAEIHGRYKNFLLILQNNEYPVLYQLKDFPNQKSEVKNLNSEKQVRN